MRARSARVISSTGTPLTLRAAHSIAPQMGQGDHLVIVDNGSDDDSLTVLRDGLDELRGVADPRACPRERRTNDSRCRRHGRSRRPGEDSVVLLNNDATVRDGFLDALLEPWARAWAPRPHSSS